MKYFKTNQTKLAKEIKHEVLVNAKVWQKTHPWAKDSLDRLAVYATRGKMLRGQLVLLAAGTSKFKQALPAAVAMELMHSGILIHDDIMDRDLKRRGLPTMHAQYSKLASSKNSNEKIHFGESMASCVAIISYYLAFGQLSKIKNNTELIKLFSDEMAVLGMGQMEDVDTATHSHKVTEKSAFRIYEQKTGRYTFALPIVAGLMIADKATNANQKKVFDLSHYLGIMFQLRDDILGVYGDSKKTGKSVGGDIREKKLTWLYFKVLKTADKADKAKLQKLYGKDKQLTKTEQAWVTKTFDKYDVLSLAQTALVECHAKASAGLSTLPFDKAQKQTMQELLDYLVVREK